MPHVQYMFMLPQRHTYLLNRVDEVLRKTSVQCILELRLGDVLKGGQDRVLNLRLNSILDQPCRVPGELRGDELDELLLTHNILVLLAHANLIHALF